MDDARELQYGIEFETGEAEGSVDQLGEGIDRLEQRIGAAEMGAQRMGAGVVSACDSGAAGADRFTGAVDRTSEAMGDMEDTTRSAADTARRFGSGLDEAGEDAEALRARVRETAESAADLGTAFRETMADGLEAGQSIAKSFGTGLTGAIDFSRNKVKTFVNDTVKGAQNIATKFKHPIQTIRTNLVKALRTAQKRTEDLGEEAEDTERDLRDMGDAGEAAGNQVSEAIKSAVAAFVGFEAIKQGIGLLKEFGASALDAFTAAESKAKQFDVLFSESAADWVDNYAAAVHRSTSEVMDFMVQNKTLYQELGITGEAAEELSSITTSLAYDFGNAFSMDDAEALGLIQSAIQGDTAALNAYGITLDETALKQSAAALGLSENIDALDDAAMAQVRLNALLEESGAIQEAAINQTGGLTNSMKSLNGVWSNFLSTAGGKFAPVVENLVGAVVDNWPTVEPMLLSFVDVLADGIGGVAPTLIELAQNLIPSVTSVLGTLVGAAGPVLEVFTSIASSALPPLAEIVDSLVSTALPPFLSILETLNTNVVQPLIPVIQQVAQQVLPVLGQQFNFVAAIISQVATSVIPPLTQILGVLMQAIQPIISAAQNFLSVLLPPLLSLISTAGNLLSSVVLPAVSALSPALSVVGDILGVIGDVLGKVVGWVADGAGKVVDFFGKLFGGAKESSAAVEELGNSVTDLGAATESVKSPEIEIPKPEVPEIPAITVPVEPMPFEMPDFTANLTPLPLPVTAEVPEIVPPAVDAVNIPVSVETPIVPEPEVSPVVVPVTAEKPVIPEPDIVAVSLPVEVQKPVIPEPDPPEMPKLTLGAANTAPFNQSISKATQDASQAAQASSKAVLTFYEGAMDNVGTAASSVYAEAARAAESSWSRMAEAARDGARNIVASFQDIGNAAGRVGNMRLSVSGASIPGHASGTPSFEGGWTRINEEGGELAYLPGGTAIIPADQTDKIINNSTSTSSSESSVYTDNSSFAPQLSINLGSGAEGVDEEALLARIRDELEKFWREKKEEEYHKRALQGAHAR